MKHQSTVEKYAKEYRISDYVNYLLAIMQVESGGTGTTDVMQASESLGLPLNSLSVEESIKQGCKYFSELLAAAETKGCDLNSVIQSYNYGGGFLDYVAGRGKNTLLNWQRASQGTNPAERKSPTPTCCGREKRGLAVFLWKYVLCPLGIAIPDRGTV